MRKPLNRTISGNSIAEMPVALIVIFCGMFFPLLILGSITLRTTLMSAAIKDAAHAAAKAKTFSSGTAAKPSAQEIAAVEAGRAAAKFSGITLDNVQTGIVTTNLASKQVTRSTSPLTVVDTSKNVYAIEVTARGRVEPIVRSKTGFLGNIPGLTGPMPLLMVASEMAENPQGLNE